MMRRSWGMGGARMLRAMGRSVGASVKERCSPRDGAHGNAAKSVARAVSVSSPTASGTLTCYVDGDEWEAVGDDLDGDAFDGFGFGFRERFVFEPAPTEEETQEAMATMEQMFVPVRFSQAVGIEYPPHLDGDVDKVVISTEVAPRDGHTESELDWKEPAPEFFSKSSHSDEQEFADAILLYQRNPPFKSMVKALASDPAVWHSVMNNRVVQELKNAFCEAQSSEPRVPNGDPDGPTGILWWIMDGTKGKIMEFFAVISKLVNKIIHPPEDKKSEEFNTFVRSSFMLCVMAFIIVTAARIQKS